MLPRITKNEDIIPKRQYVCRHKESKRLELLKCSTAYGMKYLHNGKIAALWCYKDDSKALDKFEIYGPLDLESLIEESNENS